MAYIKYEPADIEIGHDPDADEAQAGGDNLSLAKDISHNTDECLRWRSAPTVIKLTAQRQCIEAGDEDYVQLYQLFMEGMEFKNRDEVEDAWPEIEFGFDVSRNDTVECVRSSVFKRILMGEYKLSWRRGGAISESLGMSAFHVASTDNLDAGPVNTYLDLIPTEDL